MSDKTLFGCAETGTYQTSAPNPHIDLSGTASSSYSIAQLFADAMSTDETATVSIVKDKDNWAVYGGVKFSNDTVDTLDLSVATLLESKGTLSDEDTVTCLGLAPGRRGVDVLRVNLTEAANSPNATYAKIAMNNVEADSGGWWDADNTRAQPTVAGYYLVSIHARVSVAVTGLLTAIYRNGASYRVVGADVAITNNFGNGGTALVYCDGSTHYIEPWVYTSSSKAYDVGGSATYMEIIGPLAS